MLQKIALHSLLDDDDVFHDYVVELAQTYTKEEDFILLMDPLSGLFMP